MIEIVLDYSRIELTSNQINQFKYRTLYELKKQDAIVAKNTLLRYINDHLEISKIYEKQLILNE